jgi:hypothetical protein
MNALSELLVGLLNEHDQRQSWAGSSYNGSDLQTRTRAVLLKAENDAYHDHLFAQGGLGAASDGTDI